MEADDDLYKLFLEEMHELESFRMTYAASHPAAPLDRDDPDVRRLIEAMAFFAARTHTAGLRNLTASRRRIFQQFFPYLLAPLPAMGMLAAHPTGQLAEPVFFPAGTEIAVAPESGGLAIFRTMRDLSILPLTLDQVTLLELPQKRFRLVLALSTPYPRNEDLGTLSFYLNYLDEFHASLRVLHTLRSCLERAVVSFEERVDENTKGTACGVSFGLLRPSDESDRPHPLDEERLYFHFPQRELFLNLEVPKPPRNWQRFALCLDLDARWPRALRLNEDVFQLFATPIINSERGMAQPVVCDGTREQYPVLHPDLASRFELHSVRGVYRVDKGRMVPLRAGVLAGGSGSYEIEEVWGKGKARHCIDLHFPEAFERPSTVAIDALWLQPWFSQVMQERLQAQPYRRLVAGMRWELMDGMVAHHEGGFGERMDEYLHLLAAQNQSMLSHDDLTVLLQTLGSVWAGPFAQVRDLLAGVRVEEVPLQKQDAGGTVKLIYHLRFKEEMDATSRPLVESFLEHLERILDAWIAEAKVEVRLDDRT